MRIEKQVLIPLTIMKKSLYFRVSTFSTLVGTAFTLALLDRSTASAQSVWDGGGGNNNWTSAANWEGNVLPLNNGTANVVFSGATRLTPDVDIAQDINRIAFEAGSSSFNVGGGGMLTLRSTGTDYNTAAISNRSSVLQTVSTSISLGPGAGNSFFFAASGDLAISGNIAIGSRKIVINNRNGVAKDISISGDISGAGNAGAILLNTGFFGILTLSGSNSYTGSTEVRDGILKVASDNALGAGAADVLLGGVSNTTPTLLIGGAFSVSHNILASNITTKEITIGGDTADISVFTGAIKLGNNAGKSVKLTASEGGTVRFDGNVVTSNSIDDLDAVTKVGKGTVILAGEANTYSGSTTVSEGTLLINGSYASEGQGVSVDIGAAFGGKGAVNRDVVIGGGGMLIGGDDSSVVGMLTISANVTMEDNSVIRMTLGSEGAHSAIARTGGVWAFDSDQSFSFNDAEAGDYLGIITGLTGQEAGLETISTWTITDPAFAGSTFSFNGGSIDLHLVPEPSTWALIALSLAFGGGILVLKARDGISV